MKQELIDKFIKDTQVLANETNKITSLSTQILAYFEGIKKILFPIWEDGFNEGVKEGIRKERERVRITKSN